MRTTVYILVACLISQISSHASPDIPNWKMTLKKYVSPGAPIIPGPDINMMRLYYIVPADVSIILENEQKDSLISYLSELQHIYPTNSLGYMITDEWLAISKRGLHGTPMVSWGSDYSKRVTNSLVSYDMSSPTNK
jgi:hypothetical protein